jgi:transposase
MRRRQFIVLVGTAAAAWPIAARGQKRLPSIGILRINPKQSEVFAELFRRDMARLALVREQISSIEKTRAERLERAPNTGPHAMVRLLARVIGIGIETADMLVREILSRKLRDRRAVARYAGLTGSPDESGLKRREKGLAKAGKWRGYDVG